MVEATGTNGKLSQESKDNVLEKETYKNIANLSKGSKGYIYHVKSERTGIEYVLRRKFSNKQFNEYQIKYGVTKFIQEARIRQIFKHANIVSMHDFYVEENDEIHLIQEYADDGSLEMHIEEREIADNLYT